MRKISYILLFSLIIVLPAKGQEHPVFQYPERIFLHTDRDTYLAGEELFYSMYIKGTGGQLSRYAYILLRDQKNRVVNFVRLDIKDKGSFGSVSLPDTLSTGLYQVLCYTNLMRNFEESIFAKEIVIANRFDEKMIIDPYRSGENDNLSSDQGNLQGENTGELVIIPEKSSYRPGEKITFTIEAKDVSFNSVQKLSISVSEVFPGFSEGNTISEWFTSGKYLSQKTYNNISSCEFYPEYDRSVLQGKFTPSPRQGYQNGSILKEAEGKQGIYTVLLSVVDTSANLQFTKTDSLGRFSIFLDPYYEDKEVIIRVRENIGGVIEMDNKSKLNKPFRPSGNYSLQAQRSFLLRMSKLGMINRYYNNMILTDTLKYARERAFLPVVFARKYIEIIPSDYVELNDFLEISREILPSFKIRKSDGKYISSFTNLQYSSGSSDEPAVFLDGVMIDDIEQVVNLTASEIKRIITVPVQRVYGDMSFNGILCISSFDLVINDFQFSAPALRYKTPSNQLFIKPLPFIPGLTGDHYPDFRQVLFWEPELKPGKDATIVVECFASDLNGLYRINVQGVTLTGDPLSGSEIITITGK